MARSLLSPDQLEPLHEWQGVKSFAERTAELNCKDRAAIFTERGGQKLQEATSLSAFCRALRMTECRLCRNDPPDGQSKDANGEIFNIEVTMAITPGRPVTAQYLPKDDPKHKPRAPSTEDDEQRDVEQKWQTWILPAISNKLKRYGVLPYSDLLVYNNIDWLFEPVGWQDLTGQIAKLSPTIENVRIWQHTSEFLYQLWPNPKRFDIPHIGSFAP